jgi:hypothetical protein
MTDGFMTVDAETIGDLLRAAGLTGVGTSIRPIAGNR